MSMVAAEGAHPVILRLRKANGCAVVGAVRVVVSPGARDGNPPAVICLLSLQHSRGTKRAAHVHEVPYLVAFPAGCPARNAPPSHQREAVGARYLLDPVPSARVEAGEPYAPRPAVLVVVLRLAVDAGRRPEYS